MISINYYGQKKHPGDDIHVDIIGIPGATIKMLNHAFMAEFKNSYRPMFCLLEGWTTSWGEDL